MKPSPLSISELRRWLPERPRNSHKGRFGHALIVAGSRGMCGAAVLAARAALRSGAGLVSLALPETEQSQVASAVPEAMTISLPATQSGALRAEAAGRLIEMHERRSYTVLAIGPGLGVAEESRKAVVGILASLRIPAVIDADAINSLAAASLEESKRLLKKRKEPVVLTPHPGELGRLLKMTASEVEADRSTAALAAVEASGGVCVLKGFRSLICGGNKLFVNSTGNSGLAKGGSGDALTGLIAGLWAQRRAADSADDGLEAACLGVYLLGAAADQAVKKTTERALLATDVIEAFPKAFRSLAG